MSKFNKISKLRYNFDNLMSKGAFAPLLLLLISVIVFTFFIALLLVLSNAIPSEIDSLGLGTDGKFGVLDTFYLVVLRMLDPGVISGDPIDLKYTIFMMLATLGGLFSISILIALINSAVLDRVHNLRKGKSPIFEDNHTVIIGWSFQVFPVISELVIANENQKRAVISILAEKDKVEMEDEIREKVGDTKNTKVVCRTGSPIDMHDLSLMNLNSARSIIIIAPDSSDPDSNVIKTILAITNNPQRKENQHKYHIVAEIRDPRNVRIAEIAGRDEVQLVVFDYIISRITAQTCRQPGLSVVFTELLDFSGDEIYFQNEPKLVGKSFSEAMFAYETSLVIGLRKSDGLLLLKPDFNAKIDMGDMIIAISEDDDTIVLSGLNNYNIDSSAIITSTPRKNINPESTLIIGWNRRATLIINELDNYVNPNSSIAILTNYALADEQLSEKCSHLENQKIELIFGDTTNRKILDEIDISRFDHIIVLSGSENDDVQSSDARTLTTLLHLRDIADRNGLNVSIVSEMLDDRNRELAEVTNTDDFIVSVKLDSLMLAQISENKELKLIFEDLFSSGGPAISTIAAENYVELGKPVNFYTILESARQKNQIAIGFKMQKSDKKIEKSELLGHGVVVNPVKSQNIFFSKGDKIIVITEDYIKKVI